MAKIQGELSKKFSYDDKIRLAEKIEKITDKKFLEIVYEVIVKFNPTAIIRYYSNDTYIKFHNLTNETYYKLIELVDERSKQNLEDSEIKDFQPYIHDDFDEMNQKLKFNTIEKNIIKRKKFQGDT